MAAFLLVTAAVAVLAGLVGLMAGSMPRTTERRPTRVRWVVITEGGLTWTSTNGHGSLRRREVNHVTGSTLQKAPCRP
jgi:hypothetical protein